MPAWYEGAESVLGCFIDPMSLPDPWCWVIWHWLHHHPDRVFLPQLDAPDRYLLSWDDLRDVMVGAGLLSAKVYIT